MGRGATVEQSRLNPQEVKNLLRFYFAGAMAQWEHESRLQRDRVIRHLNDAEQIPSTGAQLWDVLTVTQMAAIIAEIERLRVRVEYESRPGWLVHCLKCWCQHLDKNSTDFDGWPKVKKMHVKRALRELWPRLINALNGEYQ